MPTTEHIAASIEQRLVELNNEIAQLDATGQALVTDRPVRSRSAAPTTSRGGGRRPGAAEPGLSPRIMQARTSRTAGGAAGRLG